MTGAEYELVSMDKIGRFTIRGKLGQGGMGVVYRVHDPDSGSDVALKVLRHLEDLPPLVAARFTREFELLSRLSHPNLVRVYEAGVSEGVPFYTMEVLRGQLLTEVSAGLELPTEQMWGDQNNRIFGILFSLLSGIEYMHRRGIVHRDVKPSNVMVAEDGVTKLMDFGLARDESCGALTQAGSFMGTLKYCSPEQVDNTASVDARADLYSFGVMLYEMVAGRAPFEGDMWNMMSRILTEEAPCPSTFNRRMPSAVASLVVRLLQKDPSSRIQSAGKLRVALARLLEPLGVAIPQQSVEELEVPEALTPTGTVLFAPSYIPPVHALSTAQTFLTQLQTGHNGFLLVYGEEGVGKSRFAEETARQATANGVHVLRTACDAEGSAPYHALVPILQQACRTVEYDQLEPLFGHGALLLGHFLSKDVLPVGPMDEAVVDKLQLFDVVSRLLRHAAHKQPAILIVDDVQWADLDSFELLCYLVRDQAYQPSLGAPGFGVMWLCETGAEASLKERISRLTSGHPYTELSLLPMGQTDFAEMLASVLGDAEGAARIAPLLHPETGGNPAFALEALKGLVESNVLSERHGAWTPTRGWDSLTRTLPVSLREAYGQRMQLLPPAVHEVLVVAAVFGVEFNYQDLVRAASQSETAIFEALDVLLAHKILRSVRGRRKGQFAFTSPQLRRHVIQQLSFPRQQTLHRQILGGLETAFQAGDRRVLHTLALHAREAGDVARGLRYTVLAAQAAAQSVANERAADLFLAAAAMPGFEALVTPALRDTMFEVMMSAGRNQVAHDLALQAARQEKEAASQAHWLHRVARALMGQGKNDEALQYFTASLESFGFKSPVQGPALLGSMAWEFVRHLPKLRQPRGAHVPGKDSPDLTEALEVMLDIPNLYYFVRLPQRDAFFFHNILRAFNASQHIHDIDVQTLVHSCYATMMTVSARPPVALIRKFLQLSRERLPELQKPAVRIEVCRYAGYAYYLLGDYQHAQELLTQCIGNAQDCNNARGLAHGSAMLALTHWWVGPPSSLYRMSSTAAVKCEALGDTFGALARMGEVAGLGLLGRYGEAEEVLTTALKSVDEEALQLAPLALKFSQAFLLHLQGRSAEAVLGFEALHRRWLLASLDHIHPCRFALYAAMHYIRQWQSGALPALPPVLSKIQRSLLAVSALSHDLHYVHGHALMVEAQVEILQGHADKSLAKSAQGLRELQQCGATLLEIDCRLALSETLYSTGLAPYAAAAASHRTEAVRLAEEQGAPAYVAQAVRLGAPSA